MQKKVLLFILCLDLTNFNLEQHKERAGQEEKMSGTIWVAGIKKSSCGWGAFCLFNNKDTVSVTVHKEHENSSLHPAFSLTEAVF